MSEFEESEEGYPAFRIQSEEGDIILHFFNTRLRTFKDPQFNHIEYRDDEGQLKGIRASEGLMNLLFEHDFPYNYDPFLDEMSADWFASMEANHLDEEIDGLLG